MPQETRHRVPFPTDDEITVAYSAARAFVGFAGTKRGPAIYLNIAFHRGDIETVWLDALGAGRLVAVLKALAPDCAKTPASVVFEGVDGPEAREGFLPEGGLEDDA